MPRAGAPRPAPVLKNFVDGLSTALDRVAAANPNPGRPVPHLNRTEYTNAIRDFLALDVDGREMLPADDPVTMASTISAAFFRCRLA
jgi:hypothetical protein